MCCGRLLREAAGGCVTSAWHAVSSLEYSATLFEPAEARNHSRPRKQASACHVEDHRKKYCSPSPGPAPVRPTYRPDRGPGKRTGTRTGAGPGPDRQQHPLLQPKCTTLLALCFGYKISGIYHERFRVQAAAQCQPTAPPGGPLPLPRPCALLLVVRCLRPPLLLAFIHSLPCRAACCCGAGSAVVAGGVLVGCSSGHLDNAHALARACGPTWGHMPASQRSTALRWLRSVACPPVALTLSLSFLSESGPLPLGDRPGHAPPCARTHTRHTHIITPLHTPSTIYHGSVIDR